MLELNLNEDIPYRAELIQLKKGEPIQPENIFPAIIFIREADITIHFSTAEKKQIRKGQLFLLPRDFVCQIETEYNQEILLLQIPNLTAVYIHFMNPIVKEKVIDFKHLFYPLEIQNSITTLVDCIKFYIEQKYTTSMLAGVKTFELFYLLKSLYTEDCIQKLFAPVLNREYVFALFVLSNYGSVKNAEELASLSNYTFSGFDKQFRKVFGIAPYKWMLNKKVAKIYFEISATSKPIKVIAEEFGFINSSHLGDFCRKHLGMSPVFIRKKQIG